MKNQVWYIALLIGVMCLVRFALSMVGYIDPMWLMEQISIPANTNIQMPYIVRVWAIRDIVLAVLVAFSDRNAVRSLLFACILIDCGDILSAHLSGIAGLFNPSEVWSLKLTAIFALIPESVATFLIIKSEQSSQNSDKGETA